MGGTRKPKLNASTVAHTPAAWASAGQTRAPASRPTAASGSALPGRSRARRGAVTARGPAPLAHDEAPCTVASAPNPAYGAGGSFASAPRAPAGPARLRRQA
jgi:hypothetical protein